MNYSNKLPDKTTHINISVFGGLNRRIKASAGEFSDLENIGHGEYPCLSSTKNHKEVYSPGGEIIKYMTPVYLNKDVTGFSGIVKKNDGKYSILIDGSAKLSDITSFDDAVDYNGSIITFPEFKGYNYIREGFGANDLHLKEFRNFDTFTITTSGDDAESFTATIKYNTRSGNKPSDFYKVGQMLEFYGFSGEYEQNNTYFPETNQDYSNTTQPVSITVKDVNDYTITVIARNAKGNRIRLKAGNALTSSDGGIRQYIPRFNCQCIHNNRLWTGSVSGEMVYASALGDPFEFYELGTLSTDSWYVEVGTPGKFTGIISWHSRVLAFKEECIHVIYGTEPANYSLEKSYANGCISKESLASVGSHIIWLSHDGFYEYAGGEPRRISEKLNTKYVSCVAFGDNRRYYARCEKESGEFETVIFDTETRLWSKMTDFGMRGGDFARGTTYIYNGEKVFLLNQGEHGEFFAESVEMDFGSFKDKSVIYLQIRCKMGEGAFLNVYTAVDGGEWIPHKGIDKSGKHKMPIRFNSGDTFRMRLEGKGEVHVLDMELTVNSDGV